MKLQDKMRQHITVHSILRFTTGWNVRGLHSDGSEIFSTRHREVLVLTQHSVQLVPDLSRGMTMNTHLHLGRE
jgi:hypothetical protein